MTYLTHHVVEAPEARAKYWWLDPGAGATCGRLHLATFSSRLWRYADPIKPRVLMKGRSRSKLNHYPQDGRSRTLDALN